MSKSEQEIEVKFYVRAHAPIAARLEALGARLTEPRVMETNLRFDTPTSELTRTSRVLRLRQDNHAWITYKGAARPGESVSMRQEIEIEVSDFPAARRLLEALGYIIAVIYEKYRTTYDLNGLMITLDEMPFGNFIEIEGPDAASIQAAAGQLNLDWEARSTLSYLAIFSQLIRARKLAVQHLTFDALK
ncbi:MAG TPA: class IV adenylate cyclase, partial [Anaerolineaceae bacterium]